MQFLNWVFPNRERAKAASEQAIAVLDEATRALRQENNSKPGVGRGSEDTQRLAASARELLPHLAVSLARCLREERDAATLVQEIARCGRYIEAAHGPCPPGRI